MFVACPSCTKRLNVPDDAAGQTGQCPWCKSPFRLPAPTPPAVPATPPVAAAPVLATLVTVPALAAFPVAAPMVTLPVTSAPPAPVPVPLVPLASLAPLAPEPPVAARIAVGGDGMPYPLVTDPEDDFETKVRHAQIWKEAAKNADALYRKRNPRRLDDIIWGSLFLSLMLGYVVLLAVSLRIHWPFPLLIPGILIGMAGAIAVVVVAFRDNILEGVLCIPGLPWGLTGMIFPISAPLAWFFAKRMMTIFGDDLVSEILTWTLLAVLGIVFPCYLPFYIQKNFEAACRPLYLMLIGILFQLTAFLL
jgi:hypothetical protein